MHEMSEVMNNRLKTVFVKEEDFIQPEINEKSLKWNKYQSTKMTSYKS